MKRKQPKPTASAVRFIAHSRVNRTSAEFFRTSAELLGTCGPLERRAGRWTWTFEWDAVKHPTYPALLFVFYPVTIESNKSMSGADSA